MACFDLAFPGPWYNHRPSGFLLDDVATQLAEGDVDADRPRHDALDTRRVRLCANKTLR